MVEAQRPRIVEYAPELKDAFRTLNREWIEQHFRLEPSDLEVFADPEGRILHPGGAILFAELDGEIVGTVALVRRGPERLELAKMAVTPRVQGRQIGKQLMLAALGKARALGAKQIYLETNSKLAAAVSLYRRVGFVEDLQTPPSKYERVDLTMSLAL